MIPSRRHNRNAGVPYGGGHVVFALYDGTFPSGQIVATYHLRDGTTRTKKVSSSL